MCACPTPALAVHFNVGNFVQAFEECEPGNANATTSGGVAACVPAVPVSNCDTDPSTALLLRQPGKSGFTYSNTGRRETQHNGGVVDLLSRIVIAGVASCDAARFTGDLEVEYVVRMFRDDPACGAGGCILPDFSFTSPVACKNGKCKAKLRANEWLVLAGKAPLPSDHVFEMKFQSVRILDLAGRVFLRMGLQTDVPGTSASSAPAWHPRYWLAWLVERVVAVREAIAYGQTSPSRARQSLARYVQAYVPCAPGTEDVVTGDGLAACTAVPISNCATDPTNAIVAAVPIQEHTNAGRGKIKISLKNARVRLKGNFDGIEHCDGEQYTGPVELSVLSRATLNDPGCGSEPCTTVDTALFAIDLDIENGRAGISTKAQLSELGPFPGSALTISAEIIEAQLLDQSGNLALVSPSTQVRCNTGEGGEGTGFCYGN